MKLNLTKPLIIFDLETTGLDISKDRIIQISYIKAMPDGTETRRNYMVNPECKLPPMITEITSITDEMLADKPTFKELAGTLVKDFEGCDFAGFNSNRFDVPMLAEEMLRAGQSIDFSKCRYKFYCGRKMEDDFQAHLADQDTEATWKVLQAQLDMYDPAKQEEEDRKLENNMDVLNEFSRQNDNVDFAGRMVWGDVKGPDGKPLLDKNGKPRKQEVFNFGKYKGMAVADVLRRDPGYYSWMIGGDFPLETKQWMTRIKMREIYTVAMVWLCNAFSFAQEFKAKFTINHNAIQLADETIYDKMKETMEEFFNNRQWTNLHFKENERINANFNITVKKLSGDYTWGCTATIQATRPVYNSSYTTVFYNNTDQNFDFQFTQFDQIEFNEENIDNQLTALLAYYAYLLIGLDLDTFAPNGGEEVLQRCMNLTNNAQNLEYLGWKAFDNSRNRFAIINDYLDGAMAPFRQLQYNYYRKGLDEMANNAERGRTEISTAIQENLKNIYKGKGTQKEKESVYDILFSINASQNNTWEKIKQ